MDRGVYLLLFIPIIIGVAMGILMLFLTKILKKIKSAYIAKVPAFIGLFIFVIAMLLSVYIRGFEGASYAVLGIIILIFTIISYSNARRINQHR